MTQLHDDVNGWYGGRLRPVPDPPPDDDRDEPRPAATDHRADEATGLWDASELWEGDGATGDGEPLFEQLRSAYLHGDDSSEWARDGQDTGGWAAADSGQWDTGAVGVTDDQDRYHWVDSAADWDSGSEAWDDDAEYDDYEDLDDEEEDELDPEPVAPRARGRRRSAPGRAGLRRTSTLLNATSVLLFVVGALLAAGLSAWILWARLLTTRQLFFLIHSTLGIIIVHAFGGGLGTLLTSGDSRMKDRIRKWSTAAMAVVAWLASAVGTWFGYAGYRAKVPPGGDIAMYPREYLLHSPQLAFWETFAMEWKVHIGWTTPFLATAVAFTALRYRRRLVADRLVRKVMTIMLLLAFAGALVAAGLGAVINVTAPNDFMHRGWSP
ncbi:MAG TPA: hypothetical protein VHK02_08910 [Actinomycetota bacterium]|nr:hypothetical protein [Actinomycetota bacterium]